MNDFHGGEIRNRVMLKDFIHVMNVIQYFPLYEEVSEARLKKLFVNLIDGGYVFGYYTKSGECAGIIGIELYGNKKNPSFCREGERCFPCISVVATCLKFRNKGICTELIQYAVNYFKELGYEDIYLKNNLDNSMIQSIAKENGFITLFDVIETSKYRNVYGVDQERIWSFMRKEL